MNIPAINLSSFDNRISANGKNLNNNNVIQPKYSHTLASDTVSFRGNEKAFAKISDFLEAQVAAENPRLLRIATTYLDVLESVAFRLKEYGFSFDRFYCELHPVKSPEASVSKVVRSGKFKVPDAIRATLYCNNSYDLNSINLLLAEMKKRGYVLAETEMSIKDLIKRGYHPTEAELKDTSIEKIVPDLDIRLDNVSDQITKLPKELLYSISKPQKSGYEDIQMRFIRDFDKRKNPVQHELIVLFGPNYSIAKHDESERVYGIVRKFNELNMQFSDKTIGSHSQKAARYISLIEQMFTGKISQKLYLNAKNKDLYDLSEDIPIYFSETDCAVFDNYFSGLRDRLNSLYSEARKAAEISDTAKKQLAKDLRHDRNLINKIHDQLKETIEYYNYQNGLKSN